VPRHNQRAAGFQDERHAWYDEFSEQSVEPFELALNAAALRRIDDRELPQVDDVPCRNDIGPSEEHHHVAVGMGAGLTNDLHRVVVYVERPIAGGERVVRQHLGR
jgi:hypothetical protein